MRTSLARLWVGVLTAALAAAVGPQQAAAAPATDAVTISASQAKTGLAILSPRDLDAETTMTLDQQVAFENQMVRDLVEAKVKLVRFEVWAEGENPVDITRYRRLIDKLPADTKIVLVLSHALVNGGVSNSGVPSTVPYPYQLQESVAVGAYPEYGTTTKFMRVWLDKALLVAAAFRPRLAAIEVFNEVNQMGVYKPNNPDPYILPPSVYASVISKFYRYCKLVGSKPCGTVPVITMGLHPARDNGAAANPGANDDGRYLYDMLSSPRMTDFRVANGGRWPFDGIGYHPYPFLMGLNLPLGYANTDTATLLTGINSRLNELRAVINGRQVPAASSQFWLTEVGFNSNDVSSQPTLEGKEAKQGLYLKDVFTALSARSDVAQAVWYRYHEGNAGAPRENWGMVAHTNRFYGNLPPRYKRVFCDFVWQRGISSTEHCPRPTQAVYRLGYPVNHGDVPLYVVEAAGAPYAAFEVQQQIGTALKSMTNACNPNAAYPCMAIDSGRFPVPSRYDSIARFRVRHNGTILKGPWSDWMAFTPLIGTTAGVYGPAPGATFNFTNQIVTFPVAVPTQWLANHPTGQPYLRFTQSIGNRTQLYKRPSMPAVPSNHAETSNHALYIFVAAVDPYPGYGFVTGPVSFQFGIAPAGCRTNLDLCNPINAAETVSFSFNHA